DCSINPYCEWLLTGKWEKAVIAWLVGTEPRSVFAREGWDPKVGSGFTFNAGMANLEFVRLDGNIEVYRDKETGNELYTGRTTTPINSLYESAARIIRGHLRTVGESPVTGADAQHVTRAIAMLEEVLSRVANEWRVHWFLGKGH